MPDYISNFIICLGIFWVGYQVGKLLTIVKIAKEVASQINETNNSTEQQIVIEKHHDQYYLFNEENKFLAQGEDFTELMNNLKSRFPGQDFKIVKDQNNLTEEESGRMVKAIFEVFGDKNQDVKA